MGQKKDKRHYFRRFLVVMGLVSCITLLVIAGLSLYANLERTDAKILDDSDLMVKNEKVTDSENAYLDFAKIKISKDDAKKIYDLVNGGKWDNVKAQNLLSSNQNNLSYFDNGSLKTKFSSVVEFDRNNPRNLNYSIAGLERVKIRLLASQGKPEEALDEAIKFLKFANNVETKASLHDGFGNGMNFKSQALNEIERIVFTGQISYAIAKSKLADIEKYQSSKEGVDRYLKMSYLGNKKILADNNDLLGIGDGKRSKTTFYNKPNDTVNKLAETTRDFLRQNEEGCINGGKEFYQQRIYIINGSSGGFESGTIGPIVNIMLTKNSYGLRSLNYALNQYGYIKGDRCKTESEFKKMLDFLK